MRKTMSLGLMVCLAFIAPNPMRAQNSTDQPSLSPGTNTPTVQSQEQDGYDGIPWGSSVSEYSAVKKVAGDNLWKSEPGFGVDVKDVNVEEGVNYFLMNFHRVDFNEDENVANFLTIEDPDNYTHYSFYKGKFVAALSTIDPKNVTQVFRTIKAKNHFDHDYIFKTETLSGPAFLKRHFIYHVFIKNSSTKICLMEIKDYGPNGSVLPSVDDSFVLFYISSDYLKNSAYQDWLTEKNQTNLKNKKEEQDQLKTDLGKVQ